MRDELESIASKAKSMTGLKSGDYVIDIGANDGTLFKKLWCRRFEHCRV